MIKLTEVQIKLVEQLLLTIKNNEVVIGYKELGERVTPKVYHRNVPHNIGEISKLCYELGLPFLSAKVVNKNTNKAGGGFYELYTSYFPDAKKLNEEQVFKEECKKIEHCKEWNKLTDYLGIDIDLSMSSKDDIDCLNLPMRILPMSKEKEFPEMTIERVQSEYFCKELIDHKGIYHYKKAGMNASAGTLVLFQFDNEIIAAAKLMSVKRFKEPEDGYSGFYKFDVNSIIIFEPISIDEIHQIDSRITIFSQAKQKVSASCSLEINQLIQKKRLPSISEELPMKESMKLKEGAKKQIWINAYERNYKARKACIDYYGCICSVCGFDFGKFYGDEFRGIIHVHHLKALSEINEEYEVNPIKDLRPVCPNCHAALHSKEGDSSYSIEEIKAKINQVADM